MVINANYKQYGYTQLIQIIIVVIMLLPNTIIIIIIILLLLFLYKSRYGTRSVLCVFFANMATL